MLNQFSRTPGFFLRKEAMDKLENARVAVFGIRELEVMYMKHWSEAA